MKLYNYFVLLLMVVFSASSLGLTVTFNAVTSLPDVFTVDDTNSELITCPAGPFIFAHNGTDSIVSWGIGAGVDTVPGSAGGEIPPNTGVDLQGYIEWSGVDAFYIETYASSTITSGYFIVQCGGHN